MLALLNYVSRAHEIKIRPSPVNLPSSVCGINYLWTYCMDFFQILVLAFPGPYAQTFFNLKNNDFWIFHEYFSFSLTGDPMGAKISKRYSSLKLLLNLFKLFLKFLLSCPHKSTVLDFWNFEFPIFNEFVFENFKFTNFSRKFQIQFQIHFSRFLPLLDYVSRAHEIKFVRG